MKDIASPERNVHRRCGESWEHRHTLMVRGGVGERFTIIPSTPARSSTLLACIVWTTHWWIGIAAVAERSRTTEYVAMTLDAGQRSGALPLFVDKGLREG